MRSADDEATADRRCYSTLPLLACNSLLRRACYSPLPPLPRVIISLKLVAFTDDIFVIFVIPTTSCTFVSSTTMHYIVYADAPLVPYYYSYY